MPLVFGTIPTVIRQWLPSTFAPSSSVTTTPSPVAPPPAARDRDMTFIPRRRKTSCSTAAASASSVGIIRSRDETSVTFDPSAR